MASDVEVRFVDGSDFVIYGKGFILKDDADNNFHLSPLQSPITLADTYRLKCADLSGIRLLKITLVKFTYPGQRPKIHSLSYYGSWHYCISSQAS